MQIKKKAGVRFPAGASDFSLHNVQNGSGAQPPIQLVPAAVSMGVKRPVHKANDSPPSSAEIKHNGAIHSLLPYVFMAW
jgi:hypothetical protein